MRRSMFVEDILHFRDHAFAEMNRISERDNRACISCHGVPGRVPTLYLNPPDDAGHIDAAELLENYRKLQARVDLADPERSLVLRKPLNVQTGQEEGHQGGVRLRGRGRGLRRVAELGAQASGVTGPAEVRLRAAAATPRNTNKSDLARLLNRFFEPILRLGRLSRELYALRKCA